MPISVPSVPISTHTSTYIRILLSNKSSSDSTCGGHVGVARVGGVVPLQWMRRYRACWEIGRWVRVTWLCDLVKSDSHFAIVIHSWMVVLIHSWMVLLMIF